jgi:hypothetical protein
MSCTSRTYLQWTPLEGVLPKLQSFTVSVVAAHSARLYVTGALLFFDLFIFLCSPFLFTLFFTYRQREFEDLFSAASEVMFCFFKKSCS